jgi:hypothetical protein
LIIALFGSNITKEKIETILTKTKMNDVDKWFDSMMGKTNLSKRKNAFAFT